MTCNMSTAAGNCTCAGAAVGAPGSGRERPFHASAVAAATGLSSLVNSAASTDGAPSRLIEWAAPAPAWLLAFSSAAFFLLAFFAFSQYRKRVTRTLSSGGDEGGVGSGSSDPPATSLPNASGGRLPDFLFPALTSRTPETCTIAALPASAFGSPELPVRRCTGVCRTCENIFSLNVSSALQPSTMYATSIRATRAGGARYNASTEGLAAAPFNNLSVSPRAVRSAAGASATAAATARALSLPAAVLPAGNNSRDSAVAVTGAINSQVKFSTDINTGHSGAGVDASKYTGNAAIAATDSLGSSAELSPSMSTIFPDSAYSEAPPLLSVTTAVPGAATARLPRCFGDCRSIKGHGLLRVDGHPIPGAKRTVTSGQEVASCSFKRASLEARDVPTAVARLPAVLFSNPPFLDQTNAAAVCGSAAVTSDCDGTSPYGTTAQHPAFTPLTDSVSAASRAAAAAAKGAGSFCYNCASASCSSSRDTLVDVPASGRPFLLQREVALHAAALPEGRRWRYSGRRFRDLARDEDLDGASAAPTEKRISREADATATHEGSGRAAAAARSAALSAGPRGPRGRAAADDGGETETAESGNTTEAIEETEYASLAVDEEDVSVAPCAAARTTFTFDGASMRSVILAVITAAALLRALLLLLQLVANPLEGKRPAPPRAVNCLPLRASFLPASRGRRLDATAVIEEGGHIINDDTDAAALSSSHTNRLRSAVSISRYLSAKPFGPQSPTAAVPKSFLFPAIESGRMLSSSAAASRSRSHQKPDKTRVVAATAPSEVNYDGTSTTASYRLQEYPAFPAASLKAGSSRPRILPPGSTAAEATTAAASTPLSLAGSARSLLPQKEMTFTVSSPTLLIHAPLLQVLPTPQHSSASRANRPSTPETEMAVVSAATPAQTAGITPMLSATASTDRTSHPQVPRGLDMLHSLIVTGTPAPGQTTAAASTTAPAAAARREQTDKQGHDLASSHASHVMVEGKAYYGALKRDEDKVAGDSSSPSSSTPRDSSGLPVNGDSTDNNSSALRRFRSSVNLNSSNVKNMSDSSGLNSGNRDKPAEVTFGKWVSSTRDDGRRRITARTKKPRGASSRSRPARKNMRRFRQSRRASTPSNTPTANSRSGSGGKAGRTGWPSALWLRTLARSLPPMLCVKAYALLILFLLDLYYASSRLENVRWIAVGGYIFLGGVWVLFASVAGLTVAEDNTRREAAHLFARVAAVACNDREDTRLGEILCDSASLRFVSICWLLGFCFTLLSVSLAVVGSLVLKQLRGRKSTQLFLRPPMVMHQPVGTSDGSLHAVVASNVYRPSRSCLHFAHPSLQGDAIGYLPPTAPHKDMSLVPRGYCVTGGVEEERRDTASSVPRRSKSWLPACLTKYWSANSTPTPLRAALPEEECADPTYDDAPMNLPLRHDLESQDRGGTQRVDHASGLAWIERRRQQLAEHELHSRSFRATRDARNNRDRRNVFLLPFNWFFLPRFKKSADTSPDEIASPPSYSSAWRRLFMLTLCCPPLLMMRGVHLLLVGAQIFPHYYPSFVEEKGTFDVFIYLITEWLPLTLLVCASSHTVTSKQRSNSLTAHATLLDEAHDGSCRAIQPPFPHPSQSLFNRCHYCRRDTTHTSLWPQRSKGKSGGGSARIHQPSCLFSTPLCNASVCAKQVQPQLEKQYAAQDQQRDIDKEHPHKVQHKRVDVKKERNSLWNMAVHVGDLASQKFSELPGGQYSSKTKAWTRLFCRRGEQNSELSRDTMCKVRSSDERFGVPLLTDDVLSGPQALRLAHQQHGSSSSSSSNSRRDSDGQ